MNIAIFTPSKNPYSETFIQAHKKYLKGKVFYYYGKINNMQLEGVSSLISNLKSRQFRLQRKIGNKSFSYLHEKSVLCSLRHNEIDVILVEYGTHAHHLLPVLKKSKVPFVVHFHGYDASVGKVVEKCNNYKEIFALASKIIAVSKIMEQMLLKLGCPQDKLKYNVYGPQAEFKSVLPSFSKKQFIAIGRFTDKKAPYYTILAFEEVLKKHPEATLLMAGNGPLYNMCENLIAHLNLKSAVTLLGVISSEQYLELLKESLAFVQHSITATNGDMEGTPLAVLEASVAGLPVISTRHAGIPDVIVHGKTGLLSDEHDVQSMSKNMLTLLDDLSYAKNLGLFGKAHIKSYFNIEKHIQILDEVLLDAITGL